MLTSSCSRFCSVERASPDSGADGVLDGGIASSCEGGIAGEFCEAEARNRGTPATASRLRKCGGSTGSPSKAGLNNSPAARGALFSSNFKPSSSRLERASTIRPSESNASSCSRFCSAERALSDSRADGMPGDGIASMCVGRAVETFREAGARNRVVTATASGLRKRGGSGGSPSNVRLKTSAAAGGVVCAAVLIDDIMTVASTAPLTALTFARPQQ